MDTSQIPRRELDSGPQQKSATLPENFHFVARVSVFNFVGPGGFIQIMLGDPKD